MEISEADHAAINAALIDDVDPLYRSNAKYSKDIISTSRNVILSGAKNLSSRHGDF